MTLSEWLEKNYNHITFTTKLESKGQILTVPQYNVDLTVGLISCKDKTEWCMIAFTACPLGTIIDEISDEYYSLKMLQVKQLLTKLVLTTDNKTYKKYLDVLERRDKENWSKDSQQLNITQKEDKTLDISFKIV